MLLSVRVSGYTCTCVPFRFIPSGVCLFNSHRRCQSVCTSLWWSSNWPHTSHLTPQQLTVSTVTVTHSGRYAVVYRGDLKYIPPLFYQWSWTLWILISVNSLFKLPAYYFTGCSSLLTSGVLYVYCLGCTKCSIKCTCHSMYPYLLHDS